MDNFEVNGDYVVCSLYDEQNTVERKKDLLFYNKIEEGFQKINKFKIEKLNFKNNLDFPFFINDIVIVCSSGTIVNWKDEKRWLFHPEHILARVDSI